MIARFLLWWRARSPREHGLLILLALIAVPTLLTYGVVRPLAGALDRAQVRRDAAAQDLGDVLRMSAKIRAAGVPHRDRASVAAALQAEAARGGFSGAQVTADGAGARIMIDAVRAQPFFAWVAEISRRRGLVATQLAARPNGDATLSISARFTRAE